MNKATSVDSHVYSRSATGRIDILHALQYLLGSLQQSGILAIGSEAAPPPANYHSIRLLEAPSSNILEWLATFSEHAHLMIDCPFFRLPPTDIKAHAPQFWAVLDALRPSQPLNALVQKGVSKLRAHNRRKSFTFLHLRIENDWLAHCTRWSHIPVRTHTTSPIFKRVKQHIVHRSANFAYNQQLQADVVLSTHAFHAGWYCPKQLLQQHVQPVGAFEK